jgi:hypothetical protein
MNRGVLIGTAAAVAVVVVLALALTGGDGGGDALERAESGALAPERAAADYEQVGELRGAPVAPRPRESGPELEALDEVGTPDREALAGGDCNLVVVPRTDAEFSFPVMLSVHTADPTGALRPGTAPRGSLAPVAAFHVEYLHGANGGWRHVRHPGIPFAGHGPPPARHEVRFDDMPCGSRLWVAASWTRDGRTPLPGVELAVVKVPPLRPGEHRVELDVRPLGRVGGRVALPEDAELSELEVHAPGNEQAEASYDWKRARFTLGPLPAGEHEIRVAVRAGLALEVFRRRVEVKSGALTDLGTLEVGRSAPRYRVRVVDEAGAPVTATLVLSERDEHGADTIEMGAIELLAGDELELTAGAPPAGHELLLTVLATESYGSRTVELTTGVPRGPLDIRVPGRGGAGFALTLEFVREGGSVSPGVVWRLDGPAGSLGGVAGQLAVDPFAWDGTSGAGGSGLRALVPPYHPAVAAGEVRVRAWHPGARLAGEVRATVSAASPTVTIPLAPAERRLTGELRVRWRGKPLQEGEVVLCLVPASMETPPRLPEERVRNRFSSSFSDLPELATLGPGRFELFCPPDLSGLALCFYDPVTGTPLALRPLPAGDIDLGRVTVEMP